MKIPNITGIIDRRILINYQADKITIEKILPAPFRPKLVKGKAIVGICLIRLKKIRPKMIPLNTGISSENGAHRIAVEWIENGEVKEGVFIPRRDTSSQINALAGGRLFPGVHHKAIFNVKEENGQYNIGFVSADGTHLKISARETNHWNSQSVFENLHNASAFFKTGAVGYSPDEYRNRLDGLELKTRQWEVSPLEVSSVSSSFFENENVFPVGSIKFDNALLMKNIEHEWHGLGVLKTYGKLK